MLPLSFTGSDVIAIRLSDSLVKPFRTYGTSTIFPCAPDGFMISI